MGEYVEVRIRGYLDARWAERLAGLRLTYPSQDETLLCGELYDQSALHGVLGLLRDLNIPLISVTCGGPRPATGHPPAHKKS